MKYPDDIQLKAHILQLIMGFCFLYVLKLICMFSQARGSLILMKSSKHEKRTMKAQVRSGFLLTAEN